MAFMPDFGFKKPVLAEELNDAGDGVLRRFGLANARNLRPTSAAFLTHFRVVRGKWLYASVGTTADRNVFNNVILGASFYIPRWRAAVTFGPVWARGSIEEDVLDATLAVTNPVTGLAVGSISGLRDTATWHWRPFVSVSFNPFGG